MMWRSHLEYVPSLQFRHLNHGRWGIGGIRAFCAYKCFTQCRGRTRHLNQKGRSEIVRRIVCEEQQGTRLRNLGWEIEEERERLARKIKPRLFGTDYSLTKEEGDQTGGTETSVDSQIIRSNEWQKGDECQDGVQIHKDLNKNGQQTWMRSPGSAMTDGEKGIWVGGNLWKINGGHF